jgi:hypothetical protein
MGLLTFFWNHPVWLAITIVLVATLAVEVWLRVKYQNLLWIHIYPRVYLPDDDLGYRYVPNIQGEIRIPGIHRKFRINNKGFHGRDFVETKAPDTYRIALVGTSNLTGIWMHGRGKNYAELLEDHLREAGDKVEIMNFGIDGRFRALHELRMIETDVAAYKPDLVLMDIDLPFVSGVFRRAVYKGFVIIYNPETPLSRGWCEAWVDRVTKPRWLARVYGASYIVRAIVRYYINHYNTERSFLLRVLVENRIQAPDVRLWPHSLKKSVEALHKVRDTLAAQGGRFAILQFIPNPYYRQVTAKYGLSYVELNVPAIPQFVHDRDGHYNHQGHVEVARQLFMQLKQSGVIQAGPITLEQVVAATSAQPAAVTPEQPGAVATETASAASPSPEPVAAATAEQFTAVG